MSTAVAPALSPERIARRIAARFRIAIPVDVTVLRSGIPDSVPGRSLNLGNGGMGAAVAAELFPGESVGVEFRLPYVGLPLQARALVLRWNMRDDRYPAPLPHRLDDRSELAEMRQDLFSEHLHVVDLAVEVTGFRAEPET